MENLAEQQKVEKMTTALNELQPRENFKSENIFAKVYPLVEQAISRGVTFKSIIDELKKFDLKLHSAKFKELLEKERSSRDASGNPVCCVSCGAKLSTTPQKKVAEDERGDE